MSEETVVGKYWSTNNVCTFNSSSPIPAEQLCQQHPWLLRFNNGSCTFHDHTHGTVISGFPSGKHLLVGAKTYMAANDSARQYIALLRELGIASAELNRLHVRNISLTVHLTSGYIDLVAFDKFVESCNGGRCTYEPDIFPGARLRYAKSKIVVNAFESSKFIITGAKTTREARAAFETVKPLFLKFTVYGEDERKKIEEKIKEHKIYCIKRREQETSAGPKSKRQRVETGSVSDTSDIGEFISAAQPAVVQDATAAAIDAADDDEDVEDDEIDPATSRIPEIDSNAIAAMLALINR